MGKIANYFKRLIKYVLYEHKQPIVYTNVYEKEQNEIHLNKVYLVTGGGSGLGYYISKSLINSGAIVIITGRNEEKLKKSCEELGERCKFIKMDIRNIEESKSKLTKLFEQYEHIDGLINNAGISLHEDNFLSVTEENFDNQFDTNLKGGYFLTQEYIRLYIKHKQKNGNVIFISSERGSMCDDIPYGLTKVAINSLTCGLSRRYYKEGIRINAIAPGVTCSDLTKYDKKSDLFSENASGRIFVQEEVSEVTNFILSDYSKCISGEVINCDAGNHLPHYF